MSGDGGFISRWSRRKSAAKVTPDAARVAPSPAVVPSQDGTPLPADTAPAAPEPLPPVESLTPESDFTPFMKPEVDPQTQRRAIKVLFQDPRYNVMDGLDVYIDDYSKPDPLPEGWLEKMTQMARLGEYREPEPEDVPVPEKKAPEAAPLEPPAAGTSEDATPPPKGAQSGPDAEAH
jgi:hypothetical protein